MRIAILLAGAALLLSTSGASAYMKSCAVGQRVEHDAMTGTVVQVDPGHDGQAWCYVNQDDGKQNAAWPAWMLSPSGANAAATQNLTPGHYECWGQGGAGPSAACASAGCVSMHYMFQDVNIGGGGSYADKGGRTGAWRYDPGSRTIQFASGPYAGWSAKYLDHGKIGLSPKPTNYWSMICSLK